MQEAYIAIGTKFLLNGRAFQIVESPEKDIFLCEDLGFKHVKERFTRENILFHWQYGNLQFDVKGKNTKGEIIKSYEVNDIDALKEEEKKRAYFRYECIEPLIELEAKSLDKYIRARVDQLKEKHHHDAPSRASLYRWLKYYKDSAGDLRSLVSNYNACGPTTSTLEEEVYHIIVEKINMFTKREKYTARDIHDFVIVEVNNRNMSRDEKLKLPCEQTVRRFIKRLDGYEMEKQRNGVQKARAKHKQTNLQEKPTFPLQRVEIDHTKSDLFVVDEERRLPLGRANLTTVLDVCTVYPLGYYFGFEPASYTADMHALTHAMFPKSYVKEIYPKIKNEWLAYGKPQTLVMDQGKDFTSKHMKDALFQLGITPMYCPGRSPWYKGSVERFFRTINTQFLHKIKGTTFSNILDKADYDPEKNAVITLKKLQELFHVWLIDYYTQLPRKNRLSPAMAWQEAYETMPAPALPSKAMDWKIPLMKLGNGTIQLYGIQNNFLVYQDPILMRIRKELSLKGVNSINYKYDPTNLGSIYVFDEWESNSYVEIKCTYQMYAKGLNEYTHKLIRKMIKEKGEKVSKISLAETKVYIQSLIDDEINLTKRERIQMQRVKGEGTNKLFNEETGDTHEFNEDLESLKEDLNLYRQTTFESDSQNDEEIVALQPKLLREEGLFFKNNTEDELWGTF